MNACVPVTTIGGFLGSGKTTLVNHLLAQAHAQRIMIFVNDFGAINIDADLIETVEADRISLKNGCVCCTLNEDLVSGIAKAVRNDPPEAIVIEASGIADPRSLVTSVARLEQAGLVRLDSRVCVIDAASFGGQNYEESERILDHAAASDIVLINKVDLATEESRETLRSELKVSAPFAAFVETENCAVAPGLIWGPRVRRDQAEPPLPAAPGHGFRSWSFEAAASLDRERFAAAVVKLPELCIRAKGIVFFSDTPADPQVFNFVGTRADLEPLKPVSRDTAVSRLVFIGFEDRFDADALRALFADTAGPYRSTPAVKNPGELA